MTSKNAGVALVARFLGRQNTIPIPVPFVQMLGDYTAAAFLTQCLYWSTRTSNPDGWFHKTLKQWKEELLLSPDQVRRCHKTCAAYLEIETGGENNRTHYRIQDEALAEALHLLGNPASTCGETQQPVVGFVVNRLSGKPTTLNKEAKITSETTAERAAAAPKFQSKKPQVGADRTEAPDGAGTGSADSVTGSQTEGGAETGTATDNNNVPAARPGELALISAMGRDLYAECLIEDPARAAWGDLTAEHISELRTAAKLAAQQQNLKKWRTPFIAALDKAIAPTAPATPAKSSVSDLVRAHLQGKQP